MATAFLLVGESKEALEELDAQLSQSELHRLLATTDTHVLEEWVQAQNVGLDGLVLVSPDARNDVESVCAFVDQPTGARTAPCLQ